MLSMSWNNSYTISKKLNLQQQIITRFPNGNHCVSLTWQASGAVLQKIHVFFPFGIVFLPDRNYYLVPFHSFSSKMYPNLWLQDASGIYFYGNYNE